MYINPIRITLILFFGGVLLALFTPMGLALWVLAYFVAEGADDGRV